MARKLLIILALLGLVTCGGWALAQDAAADKPAAEAANEGAPALSAEQKEVEDIQATGETFAYPYFNPKDPDPFYETDPGDDDGKITGTGLARFDVAECVLEGIASTQIGDVALYRGRDGRAYVAKAGQNFKNGLIISINPAKSEVVVRVELQDDLQVRPFEDKTYYVKNPSPKEKGFLINIR